METTEEISGTRIHTCGSTRCIHNADLRCTAETVVIGKGGECKRESWEGKNGKL